MEQVTGTQVPVEEVGPGTATHRVRYTAAAIAFHWGVALLVFLQLAIGWYMGTLGKGPDRSAWIALHKSFGLTVAALVLGRLLWRLTHPAPPLPGSMPAGERTAAHVNHYLLYVFLFVQPVSGYLSSSFSGHKTAWFGIALPQWGWKSDAINAVFNGMHVTSAFILAALIALHVLAALKHLLVDRDGVFQRMLP